MKSAEEVAEIIIGMIWNQQDHRETHRSNIAQALTAYAEERIAEWKHLAKRQNESLEIASRSIDAISEAEIKLARAEALEDAVKLIESWEPFSMPIAGATKKIRALKEKR